VSASFLVCLTMGFSFWLVVKHHRGSRARMT
jgi:hypothetical protein